MDLFCIHTLSNIRPPIFSSSSKIRKNEISSFFHTKLKVVDAHDGLLEVSELRRILTESGIFFGEVITYKAKDENKKRSQKKMEDSVMKSEEGRWRRRGRGKTKKVIFFFLRVFFFAVFEIETSSF